MADGRDEQADARRPLHADHDLLLLDLDGVVYIGGDAVPGAVDALDSLAAAGAHVGYATNNASRTPTEVAEHLRRLGVAADDDDVTTSSQAGAQLVRERLGTGARVLAVGGPGVAEALRREGLVPVDGAGARAEAPAAVLQGFGRSVGWSDLADAAAAVQRGALWVATNTDATLPTERGPAPGNGSLVRAVRAAVDVDPLVAGKPEPTLFTAAAARAGARSVLVVGDRLDTDVAGARRAGMTGALVLTGLSSARSVLDAGADQRPDILLADLGDLLAPRPRVERSGSGQAVEWRCGGASVRRDGSVLRLRTAGSAAAPGAPLGELLDVLRAAASAAWEAADAGHQVAPDEDLEARVAELDDRRAG